MSPPPIRAAAHAWLKPLPPGTSDINPEARERGRGAEGARFIRATSYTDAAHRPASLRRQTLANSALPRIPHACPR
eukprot:2635298-Prymnesium_polylepis.1